MFRAYSLLAIAFAVLGLMFANHHEAAIALYVLAGLVLAMGDECEGQRQ